MFAWYLADKRQRYRAPTDYTLLTDPRRPCYSLFYSLFFLSLSLFPSFSSLPFLATHVIVPPPCVFSRAGCGGGVTKRHSFVPLIKISLLSLPSSPLRFAVGQILSGLTRIDRVFRFVPIEERSFSREFRTRIMSYASLCILDSKKKLSRLNEFY